MGVKAAHAGKRTSFTQTIKTRDTIIADLRMQLDGHKKHRFGSRSENLDQLVMKLIQEEDEIDQSINEADPPPDTDAKPPHTPRKRKPFPKDLERVEIQITPGDACADCGGSFKELGNDVMEELE